MWALGSEPTGFKLCRAFLGYISMRTAGLRYIEAIILDLHHPNAYLLRAFQLHGILRMQPIIFIQNLIFNTFIHLLLLNFPSLHVFTFSTTSLQVLRHTQFANESVNKFCNPTDKLPTNKIFQNFPNSNEFYLSTYIRM
jgi:hypothetical protein